MTRQHALRELAIRQDAECARIFELADLWLHLCDGTWQVRDTFSTDERHLAIVQSSPGFVGQPLPERKLRVLASLLLGTPPKVVAIDAQRSLSTVTACAQDCLRVMGLEGRESRSTVLLTMSARASLRPNTGPQQGRLVELPSGGEGCFAVSALRPDLKLPVELSSAEAAVLRSLLAGHTYAQISGERATSPRTVANQLTTAFRKLGVSGRRATIDFLINASAR
jgi:DNA-binding CsgD family transcriptional regulator